MNFCNVCNNMFYMKINENNDNELLFYCRKCGNEDSILNKEFMCLTDYTETNKNFITSAINKFTKYDPTLPHIHNVTCPNKDCITNNDKENETKCEVIYIRYNDVDMKYMYLCCHCDYLWKSEIK